MSALSNVQDVRHRFLVRRLMITCPHSGQPVDTGYELPAVPWVIQAPQTLVDCIECGQDHPWRIEDAFLE